MKSANEESAKGGVNKNATKDAEKGIGKISLKEFLAKIERIRKDGGVDLSVGEDLSIAVMNLVSLEEHFFFTAMKTDKDEYHGLSAEIRNLRKQLLSDLMPNHEGETWCASKHLLSATMRLIEVGNKLRAEGQTDRALETFRRAYRLYSIFWGLKLRLINVKGAGSAAADAATNAVAGLTAAEATATGATITGAAGGSARLEDLVNKLADCCEE